MANENETKLRAAVGPSGTESPEESPADVLEMSSGYIYLMLSEEQDAGKVGWSREYPTDRLVKAQTNNPAPLVLDIVVMGNRIAEGALHEALASRRIRGEWFRGAEFLVNVFAQIHEATIDADDEHIPLTPVAARRCVEEITLGPVG